MAFLDSIKDKFTSAAQSVTTKTKKSLESTKLGGEIRSANGDLEDLFKQLGRAYYEDCSDTAKIKALISSIDELNERIEDLEIQRRSLRDEYECPACGEILKTDVRFCSYCGARLPEVKAVEPKEIIDEEPAEEPEAEVLEPDVIEDEPAEEPDEDTYAE